MSTNLCKSCGAEIVWLKTAIGKSMPVDVDTVTNGEKTFNHGKHVSHFATCPQANKHRKPKKDGK